MFFFLFFFKIELLYRIIIDDQQFSMYLSCCFICRQTLTRSNLFLPFFYNFFFSSFISLLYVWKIVIFISYFWLHSIDLTRTTVQPSLITLTISKLIFISVFVCQQSMRIYLFYYYFCDVIDKIILFIFFSVRIACFFLCSPQWKQTIMGYLIVVTHNRSVGFYECVCCVCVCWATCLSSSIKSV